MKLITLLTLVLLFAAPRAALHAAEAAAPAEKPAATAKPNIIVILADDLGRSDYSAYGTKDIRTPHIDRLFQEGLSFQNFYANCCVCSPTRAALLTGCYPGRVGVPGVIREETPDGSWGYLAPQAVLLPQLLKPAGYHTAIIGKWHLGIASPNTPTERGFDFFHGFLGDMVDDYWKHTRNGHNFMRRNLDVVETSGRHLTDVYTDWACEYLTERKKAGEPFFLYLAHNAPHAPVQPPPEWLEKVRQREPNISPKRAKIVAFVEHMDAGIGQVLDKLDELDLAKNTLVLFTSDNGGALNEGSTNGPWRGGKTDLYEGGLRVPCAARWPGVIAPGSSTDRTALSMDIFATACEAAGVAPPANIDGASFLPALRGETQPADPRAFCFAWRDHILHHEGQLCQAVRRGEWKLLQQTPFRPFELYNLQSDPREQTDVAAKNPKIYYGLGAILRKQLQRSGSVPWQPAEQQP